MRTKLLGLTLAGALLVGGAGAVLAQSGAAPGAPVTAGHAVGAAGTLLADVLSDLVKDGTISQGQADAIADALEERRTELREAAQAVREQWRQFLEDRTLSADELAQLPEDHPLRNLDRYLEDGRLTEDELRQLRGGRLGFGFGRGHGHGAGPWAPPALDDGATGADDRDGSGTSTS